MRQIQQVAKRMGYFLATHPSPIAWPGHVLSRFPILESRTFSHADPCVDVPPFSRTAGASLVQINEGERLWIVDVHLHPGDVELRKVEGKLLRERVEALLIDTPNVVVLGDFNSEVDEAVHEYLRELGFVNAMEQVGGGIQATMDTVGIQTHYIDHLYFSPGKQQRTSLLRMWCARMDSDMTGPKLKDAGSIQTICPSPLKSTGTLPGAYHERTNSGGKLGH